MTLYTTHCPKCKVLEAKLKQKNIEYIECDDMEKMKALGLKRAPVLEVDGKLIDFTEAVKLINNM